MTVARLILPETTYLMTRRCAWRQAMLAPRPIVEQVVGYCLGLAAARFEVDVHAVVVMSNHYHAVVTDRSGCVSDFMQQAHSLIARCLNAHRGRWENVWCSGRPSLVRLVEQEDVLEKMVYTLTNPVSAGLVTSHDCWPGLVTRATSVGGRPRRFKRPRKLFRRDSNLPATVELPWVVPACFGDMRPGEFAARLSARVAAREELLVAEAKRAGRTFLGVRAAKGLSWRSAPSSRAPRRRLSPTIACKDPSRRAQELHALATFRAAYRAALLAWRAGYRDTIFPAGTYLMVRDHNVRHHPPPCPFAT